MTADDKNGYEVLSSPFSAEGRKRMVTGGIAEFDDSFLLTDDFGRQADRR